MTDEPLKMNTNETVGMKELLGDVQHKYPLIYHLNRIYAQGEIQAQYAEYKD